MLPEGIRAFTAVSLIHILCSQELPPEFAIREFDPRPSPDPYAVRIADPVLTAFMLKGALSINVLKDTKTDTVPERAPRDTAVCLLRKELCM